MTHLTAVRRSRRRLAGGHDHTPSPLETAQRRWGIAFAAPVIVYLGVFWIYPFFLAVYYSFTNFDLIQADWIGASNYEFLGEDPSFHNSARVTLWFVLGALVPTTVIALLLALPLSRPGHSSTLFRSLFFLPAVLPLVAAAILWKVIYATDGLANTLLAHVGLDRIDWLTSPGVALWSLVIMVVWRDLGFFLIIFVAGLQTIPQTLYHAASIDGSRHVRTFLWVTLPLMRRTLLFVVVIGTIGAMQSFVPAYILTLGGPAESTQVLPLYLYINAFQFTNMGYASALAVLLFVVLVSLSLFQFRILRTKW